MSFRVQLALVRAQEFGRVAAGWQIGCLQKLYRDWPLSGDDEWLRVLWPGPGALWSFAGMIARPGEEASAPCTM